MYVGAVESRSGGGAVSATVGDRCLGACVLVSGSFFFHLLLLSAAEGVEGERAELMGSLVCSIRTGRRTISRRFGMWSIGRRRRSAMSRVGSGLGGRAWWMGGVACLWVKQLYEG